MILDIRKHFKNGNLLSESTIKAKLGAAGRNRRDYLHGVIKAYDAGDGDLEKLRKAMKYQLNAEDEHENSEGSEDEQENEEGDEDASEENEDKEADEAEADEPEGDEEDEISN
ncbi:hypothetical protein R1sor_011043 [Riccia sorocarpa]|uniref:Uncharacterized protein n=1 Tax=Riccia sorocarpa TaxID=122646 RepID=A0ABD3I2H2_9MARC